MKKAISLLLCLALGAALLAGCGKAAPESGTEETAAHSPVTETAEPAGETTAETSPAENDGTPVTEIVFTGDDILIDGDGAETEDGIELLIACGGVYRISGTASSARVVAAAADTENITLILAGCDLTCADDEVIYIKSAASARVLLESGTENSLTSGEALAAALPEADEDASGAALRAKCPLTIEGDGRLTVNGFINNGIASSGDITIQSGIVDVTAVNDGVKSRARLSFEDGTLSVTAGMDGLQGDGGVDISGGTLDILTGAGADNADMKVSDSSMMGSGPRRGSGEASGETEDGGEAGTEQAEDGEETESAPSGEAGGLPRLPGMGWDADDSGTGSHKGLKSDGNITISGGMIRLDTEDDAVHSGADVVISGGDITLCAGDDGIHGDASLLISDGALEVQNAYEGLEAGSIGITGGTVSVTAVDDGMNVNGGGGFGGPSREASAEAEETERPALRISGGLVLVDSGGDGLDSNGSIYIEGGAIYVSGPSTDWDAAVDYGEGSSEFVITGGTLMAAGYSGMFEAPDAAENSQGSIYYVQSGYAPDGASVTLRDRDGNVLLIHSFAHSFNCVVLSSPEIVQGGTYTLDMGGTETVIEMAETTYSNRVRGGFGGPGGGSREASAEADSDTDSDNDMTVGGETAAP